MRQGIRAGRDTYRLQQLSMSATEAPAASTRPMSTSTDIYEDVSFSGRVSCVREGISAGL